MKAMTIAATLIGFALLAPLAQAQDAPTLSAIKARGDFLCGIDPSDPGYGIADASGKWSGLNVDICIAVATAILGENPKITYVPLSTSARFTALQSGEVDLLTRGSSFTFTRDTQMAFEFPIIVFYTGDAFMVKKSLGVKSATEMSDATICALAGTATEVNVQDFARKHSISMKVLTFEKQDELLAAFQADRCDSYSTDTGSLAGLRLVLPNPDDFMILPDIMLGQYLGPVAREDDPVFENIVRWSVYAMIGAEEFGVTQANVDEQRASNTNPEVRRMLGVEGDMHTFLRLDKDWAYRIIKAVGNYGESFERNFGKNSPLKLDRGYNRLWTEGGLVWTPRWY
jgi:general L-amino acid transport system substrate-binding protein